MPPTELPASTVEGVVGGGGGAALPEATRGKMESGFGNDLSDVRVHTGTSAEGAAKSINAELEIADEAFWEYVSPRMVFEFEVEHLNGDDKPDLMLRHAAATTILVATP